MYIGARWVDISHFVNVVIRACDQCSIFSTVQQFFPDYGLLSQLHALTQVARSYALLSVAIVTHGYVTSTTQTTCYFSVLKIVALIVS